VRQPVFALTMAHGFLPKGLVEIVKQNWSGEQPLPPGLHKSSVDYLQKLRNNLEIARNYASDTAKKTQSKYIHY
jgi:hypothetical protein